MKVILLGHLKEKPIQEKIREKEVVTFEVATNEYIKELTGQKSRVTTYHKIITRKKIAIECLRTLKDNSLVLVEGAVIDKKNNYYTILATDVSFVA